MLRFPCSNCGFGLTAPEDFGGGIAKCPKCKEQVAIPGVKAKLPKDITKLAEAIASPQDRAPLWLRLSYYVVGILSAACLVLILYTAYRVEGLAQESAAISAARSIAADQKAFNDDLLRRATLAQEEAERKLALATERNEAAEDAPRRAASLVQKAEEERKKAEEERKTLEAERKNADERALAEAKQSAAARKELQQLERDVQTEKNEAIATKMKAEELNKVAQQAKLDAATLKEEAQKKEANALEAKMEATKAKQQSEELQRRAADTLKRIEISPAMKALLGKMASKVTAERKESALALKSLGAGLYPDVIGAALCSTVATERDIPTIKAVLEALAVVDADLSPAVVSLVMAAPRVGNIPDTAPWRDAIKQINALKRSYAAPVLRQRLKTLLPELNTNDGATIALELIDSLVALSPDAASVNIITDVLSKKLNNFELQDRALAALVAIHPRAGEPVCEGFGRLAKHPDTDFLVKLATAAAGLQDKRLARELSPLRFSNRAEVRKAAEAVFRLELQK